MLLLLLLLLRACPLSRFVLFAFFPFCLLFSFSAFNQHIPFRCRRSPRTPPPHADVAAYAPDAATTTTTTTADVVAAAIGSIARR